jgi:hypothetical protein
VPQNTSKFDLDRRLLRRRGWIAPEKLEKGISALADVADKCEAVDSPQFKAAADGSGAEGE